LQFKFFTVLTHSPPAGLASKNPPAVRHLAAVVSNIDFLNEEKLVADIFGSVNVNQVFF